MLEPHGRAALEIGRKQQWNARCFLQLVNQRGRRIRLTALDSEGARTGAQHEPTDVILHDGTLQLPIFRAF